MTTTLAQMLPGQTARVRGFRDGPSLYRNLLLSMGLVPGVCFTFIRRAPLGDPVQIEVHSYQLSLRQAEAELLLIELCHPE